DNVGPRHKPIRIRRWDARRLPLEDQSVSAIATNLPFGHQIGSPGENRTLYPALLTEWTRVLQPGGRLVLLTGDRALLQRTLDRRPELRLERTLPLIVRGFRAAIYVARRT
ncbi:MAG: methyltransferase domain-containing protein, partial [Chloroflexota bacterium]